MTTNTPDGHCEKCGLEVTTGAMAAFCPHGKDCACYVPGVEEFYPESETGKQELMR